MRRDYSLLPLSALSAVREVRDRVDRAEQDAQEAVRQAALASATLTDIEDHLDTRHRSQRERLSSLGGTPGASAEDARQQMAAEMDLAERHRRERREHTELRAPTRATESVARRTLDHLRELQSSLASALAPWDHEILAARRVLDARGTTALDATPVDMALAAPPAVLLTGAETQALVSNALGVSRSSYYERYRPLLRSVGMEDALGDRWALKRFRRDEAEALVAFLQVTATS